MSLTDDHELVAWRAPEYREFRWTDGLPWAVFLAIAWLVFELTADPALTAGVFCLKFAWKDSTVALWLWRRDRRKARGRSCLLFYLAFAGWKAMMAGILVAILIQFIDVAAGGPQRPGNELIVAMSVAASGFSACCLVGILGMIVAWRGRVRVWLDSDVYWSYRDDMWPPTTCRVNHIGRVLIVTQLVALIFGTVGLMLMMMPVFNLAGGGAAGWFMLVGIIVVGVLVLWLPERIAARIGARFPHECWPEMTAATSHAE